MDKFECKGCAECCKVFGEKKGKSFLPIYFFELDNIIKKAKKKKLTVDIRPVTVLHDTLSNLPFTVVYGIFNSPCEFLDKNLCSIYQERPIVCRAFPLYHSPHHKFPVNSSFFGDCSHFDHNIFLKEIKKKPKEVTIEHYKNIYSTTYENSKEYDRIFNKITDFLRNLEKNKLLNLVELDTKEFDEKYILDFVDFMKNRKILKRKELKSFIKELKSDLKS